ncbi:MAG: hypothetical protein LUO95_12765 [Methylococcaceae bacterium]|nr:hypothetical protein [Methylococcaceae bacterium]
MHDWILLSILVEWMKGVVTITFDTYEFDYVTLTAEGLVELTIPKHDDWGESESVNSVCGPVQLGNGNYRLELKIQSGDTIILEAKSIQMPRTRRMNRATRNPSPNDNK